MGLPSVDSAIADLQKAGIRTDHGYPGARMPQITETVAAVNLEKREDRKCTLVASICGPWKLGAKACEATAAKAANAWTAAGATCTYGSCTFDGKSGMYILRVLGVWEEPSNLTADVQELPSDTP